MKKDMKFTELTAGVLILVSVLSGCAHETRGQENTEMTIPMSLRDCYGNPDLYSRDKRLPMTMTTLIELIRKVELYKGAAFDLRTLSVALLHRFRMDGIERIPDVPVSPGVVPFRPTGLQFPKHRILFQQLVPGNAYTFPNDSLTAQELCTLHFMLSSAVEPWERADEGVVCPYSLNGLRTGGSSNNWHSERVPNRDSDYSKVSVQGAELSRCPLEDGVVQTSGWGTVSPGTVLAAIAAALEPQHVQITLLLTEPADANNTGKVEKFERYKAMPLSVQLHNTWAATLAGDVAEVAVYQGPRLQGSLYIGPAGMWNDTAIPRVHYLDQKNRGLWQLTDAECRGGIDGLILGDAIQSWLQQLSRLRLSQVLDMYYSLRGVTFDPKYRACERQTMLKEIKETNDLLLTQTTNFARVLSYKSPEVVQISDEKLEEFSLRAVEAYNGHLPNLLSGLRCDDPTPHAKIHLDVILDGTWTEHDATRVLALLAQETDVSYYGSSMAVINGGDGSWILRETHNASDLFKLRNDTTDNSTTVTWPTSLDLKLSLATFSSYLADRLTEERRRNVIGGSSHVILVLGYSATTGDRDFSTSAQIISTFKQQNPDVRFVYLASESNHYRFKELSMTDPSYPDVVVLSPDRNVETVVAKIISSIATVPGRIVGAYCVDGKNQDTRNGFEAYVNPSYPLKYRIHPLFLEKTGDITLKFQGSGHGNLRMCVSRDEGSVGMDCNEVNDLEEATLKITSPCSNYPYHCPPIFLTATVTRSLIRCTEDDCRYPDQVRFLMRHEGLRCLKNPDSEGSTDMASRSIYSVSLYMAVQILLLSLVPVLIGRF